MTQPRHELPEAMVMAMLLYWATESRRTGKLHPHVATFLRAAGYNIPPDLVSFDLSDDELKRLSGQVW